MATKRLLEFSHITKTAGTSIEQLAKSHGILWGIENKQFWNGASSLARYPNHTGDAWHLPLSYLDSANLKNLLEGRDYFCVVRDPYERVVSEYYCKWGNQYFVNLQHIHSSDVSVFNANLKESLVRLMLLRENGQAFHIGHWQEQRLYVQKNGEYLLPKENIIRFEELGETLPRLFAKYRLPLAKLTSRARCNAYEKRFTAADLTRAVVELVNVLYEDDFSVLGYKMAV